MRNNDLLDSVMGVVSIAAAVVFVVGANYHAAVWAVISLTWVITANIRGKTNVR